MAETDQSPAQPVGTSWFSIIVLLPGARFLRWKQAIIFCNQTFMRQTACLANLPSAKAASRPETRCAPSWGNTTMNMHVYAIDDCSGIGLTQSVHVERDTPVHQPRSRPRPRTWQRLLSITLSVCFARQGRLEMQANLKMSACGKILLHHGVMRQVGPSAFWQSKIGQAQLANSVPMQRNNVCTACGKHSPHLVVPAFRYTHSSACAINKQQLRWPTGLRFTVKQ